MSNSKLVRKGLVAAAIVLGAAPLAATAAVAAGSPPAQPTLTALSPGNRTLTASWTETSTGTITYKAVARATGRSTHFCVTKVLHCRISSLVNGVTYCVTVTASNVSGKSPASAPLTQIVGVPLAPLSVHATALAGGKAAVHWAPPLASGVSAVTGYTASALSSSDGPFTCTTTGSARSCTITGLTKGNVYKVRVSATNKYGTGPASKAATITAK